MVKEFFIIVGLWLTALFFMMLIVSINQSDAAKASYYSYELGGRKTANGEIFNPKGFTAAHKSLPFGTRVKVTNVSNGKSVIVRINDRGPFVKGRSIDLSYAAAQKIEMLGKGVAEVEIVVLS